MGSDDPIATIQNLVVAKPFQPFRVKMSNGKTCNVEVASGWQGLVEDGKIDPKQIVEIHLLNKLDNYYHYDEYERARRAAAFDPKDYGKVLKADPAWEETKREVLDERGRECEDCGATIFLEIHHTYYVLDGRDPSDYPVNAFRVLCWKCHKQRHGYD